MRNNNIADIYSKRLHNMMFTKKRGFTFVGLLLLGALVGCSDPAPSSSYEPSYTSPSGYTPVLTPVYPSSNGYGQSAQQTQPSSSTYTLDQANQDLHREQIQLERDQLESKRYGIEQESILNNYGTFCPSTGPCD